MATLYSSSLGRGGFTLNSSATAALGTVPSGYVWVVRQVDISVANMEPGDQFLAWAEFALVVPKLGLASLPVLMNAPARGQWEGRLVLEPGDSIGVTYSGMGSTQVACAFSGYKLTTP